MEGLIASVDAAVVGAVAASIGAVAAVVAGVAGVGAWRAGNRTADATAAQTTLQAENWHVQRTPQFKVTCRRTHGDDAEMHVALVGPPGLDRIDELTVSIRDDDMDHTPRLAGGLTAEEVAAQIWGRYRFNPAADGADKTGRAPEPFPLAAGASRRFSLVPTLPPSRAIPESWQDSYADDPLRLELTARCDGHAPWRVTLDINVEPKP